MDIFNKLPSDLQEAVLNKIFQPYIKYAHNNLLSYNLNNYPIIGNQLVMVYITHLI